MITKLHGTGAPTIWNLALVSPRYSADQFVGVLKLEPWWPEVSALVNVWVADVLPADWGFVPKVVGTLSDSGLPGTGAGGNFRCSTTSSYWPHVALHEMGHAAFGLSDEYWSGTNVATGYGEGVPNLTGVTNLATLKWRHLVTTTVIPTRLNNGQSQPYIPNMDKVVGLFEGGGGFFRGVFRSQLYCRMGQDVTRPFCAVCREHIVKTLGKYKPGAVPVPTPTPTPPPPTTTVCPTCKGTGKVTVQT